MAGLCIRCGAPAKSPRSTLCATHYRETVLAEINRVFSRATRGIAPPPFPPIQDPPLPCRECANGGGLETVMECRDEACRFHRYRVLDEETQRRFCRPPIFRSELPEGDYRTRRSWRRSG